LHGSTKGGNATLSQNYTAFMAYALRTAVFSFFNQYVSGHHVCMSAEKCFCCVKQYALAKFGIDSVADLPHAMHDTILHSSLAFISQAATIQFSTIRATPSPDGNIIHSLKIAKMAPRLQSRGERIRESEELKRIREADNRARAELSGVPRAKFVTSSGTVLLVPKCPAKITPAKSPTRGPTSWLSR
jgi:hypothetical protein